MFQHSFSRRDGLIELSIESGSRKFRAVRPAVGDKAKDPAAAWWQAYQRSESLYGVAAGPEVRVMDAFCGCGGLTAGAAEAAFAVGRRLKPMVALDVDAGALNVHRQNFGTRTLINANAASLVDFQVFGGGQRAKFAYPPEIVDERLAPYVGSIDLFLAGPPCQGYSNLNNRTRRDDPRNLLYLTAVAIPVALQASAIVIENVPEVVSDRDGVVATAESLLRGAGYSFVDMKMLSADELGAAQTRKRFFLIAALQSPAGAPPTLGEIGNALKRPAAPLRWAIGDLLKRKPNGIMDSVPALSEENKRRIDYLFDTDAYDLPDDERPDCHKDGTTYRAVYGRLWWDRPAPTITTGFVTPGRGRHIHPLRRRVITAREAARIQCFPDSFRFVGVGGEEPSRNQLAKWIGDAVPPILGYAASLPAMLALSEP